MNHIVAEKFEEVKGCMRQVISFLRPRKYDCDMDFALEVEIGANYVCGYYVGREHNVRKKTIVHLTRYSILVVYGMENGNSLIEVAIFVDRRLTWSLSRST